MFNSPFQPYRRPFWGLFLLAFLWLRSSYFIIVVYFGLNYPLLVPYERLNEPLLLTALG